MRIWPLSRVVSTRDDSGHKFGPYNVAVAAQEVGLSILQKAMPERQQQAVAQADVTSAWSPTSNSVFSDVARLTANSTRVRLLECLSQADRHSILTTASGRTFYTDTVVTNQGDPAEQFFLLTKGSARHFFITPQGRKIYLQWLMPGEIFGGMALLPRPALFLVGTEVVKGSHVLIWQRDKIRNLTARYPRLLENGLTIASDYLTWYLASHLSLVCDNARQRLAHVLVSLANGIGRTCSEGLLLDITNEQLANTANITVFTASRLLAEWQRSNALIKRRGKILLRHPETLFLS